MNFIPKQETMSVFGRQLEKKIIGKLKAIENGTETVKDAGVNKLITRLKSIDEASAEELQKKYIATVKSLSKS
jgi:L-asparaginase II